jgi:hypothetical protein
VTRIGLVFMATRHDRTVPDARARVQEALDAGVRNIGIKDIGLPPLELASIARDVRDANAALFLEIVSLDRDSELRSARVAIELGVDYLLGGTRADDVAPLVRSAGLKYFPFCGSVTGHPSVLGGSIESVARSARRLSEVPAVAGLDLLAYRFVGDVPALIREVMRVAAKPVLIAGSVDRLERIEAILASGAAGFTVGTAALDGLFPAPQDLAGQLRWICAAIERSPRGRPGAGEEPLSASGQ